jgi:hypothetical protein
MSHWLARTAQPGSEWHVLVAHHHDGRERNLKNASSRQSRWNFVSVTLTVNRDGQGVAVPVPVGVLLRRTVLSGPGPFPWPGRRSSLS